MKFKELEYKYDADDISLKKYNQLVESFGKPEETMTVSSWDEYYVKDGDEFIRYRYNDDYGEMTIKRKTSTKNNNSRVEVNVKVEPNGSPNVKQFIDMQGYKFNFSIFKTCMISWFEKVVMVYYIVYDSELNEKRRFIEIEANEDFNWGSEEEAWAAVHEYENKLSVLGLTPQHRLKKSLFESFRVEPAKN